MQLEVGKIYEGKVTGITKFGAFVELEPNTTGMVHISEIANTFVNEIKDHIQEGQTVKVKVLAIGDDGKISLSIKKAAPMPPRSPRPDGGNANNNFKKRYNNQGDNRHSNNNNNNNNNRFSNRRAATVSTGPATFEDMLSKFKQNSEEKMSDLKKNIDNKRHGNSRRGGPKM